MAHLQDIDQKRSRRAKHQQLNEALSNQVAEKRMKKENDARADKSFIDSWVVNVEEENRMREAKE